jgi:uncharacterized protein (DUF952 family)
MILHICTAADWAAAQTAGRYTAESLTTEGFIHCSTLEQIARTANRFYAGRTGLLLLRIEPDRLTSEVRWEPSDGELFPHIYGPIEVAAVAGVHEFAPGEDGTFQTPDLPVS